MRVGAARASISSMKKPDGSRCTATATEGVVVAQRHRPHLEVVVAADARRRPTPKPAIHEGVEDGRCR
jgi:hypothetical protein